MSAVETEENNESPTATKVIEATIDCILSEGFYRASTNAIARRAGVTWGVIQHHFGTREALMLAVVEHAVGDMDQRFGNVSITGDTLEERVREMAEVVFTFYRDPAFLAYIQVIMNLGQDPRTADKTIESLTAVTARMGAHLPRIRAEVLGEHADLDDDFRFVFETLRGVAVNQQILRSFPNRSNDDHRGQDAQRDRLVSMVTAYLSEAVATASAA